MNDGVDLAAKHRDHRRAREVRLTGKESDDAALAGEDAVVVGLRSDDVVWPRAVNVALNLGFGQKQHVRSVPIA